MLKHIAVPIPAEIINKSADKLMEYIVTSDDPDDIQEGLKKYNQLCKLLHNDRYDYNLAELKDMYYGPFNIRPDCFTLIGGEKS